MRTKRAAMAALAAGIALAGVGCTSSAGTSSGQVPAVRTLVPASSSLPAPAGMPAGPSAAWPTYGGNAQRTDVALAAPAGSLSVAWSTKLDGAVYGQPLLIGDMVIAATEHDSIYALNAANGHVAWRVNVGTPVPLSELPCGGIDPLGITSTPVYDRAYGLIYAVAETSGYHHVLVGVSFADGTIKVERDIPAPDGQPKYDQQRPGLAIENGRVYVAFGGLEGDCGPYRGSVVGVPLAGGGPLISYVVPTSREGAIWGTAGPVAGPDGTLYVSVGNGSTASKSFDDSDSVTALSPGLTRTGIFAPTSWYQDSVGDLDLGSTQPALLSDGRIVADGKSGTAYLLNAAHLGGVGGELAQRRVCSAYGGAAVSGSIVYEPCNGGGMAALDTTGDSIRILWRGPSNATGSPVVGGGAVWVTDYSSGTLYELNPATGATQYSLPLGTPLPHFASMSMSGHDAYLGTDAGVIAVAGA